MKDLRDLKDLTIHDEPTKVLLYQQAWSCVPGVQETDRTVLFSALYKGSEIMG